MIVTRYDREEAARLTDEIGELQDYMHSKDFCDISGVMKGLLMVQLEGMRMYLGAVIRRIELLEADQCH